MDRTVFGFHLLLKLIAIIRIAARRLLGFNSLGLEGFTHVIPRDASGWNGIFNRLLDMNGIDVKIAGENCTSVVLSCSPALYPPEVPSDV